MTFPARYGPPAAQGARDAITPGLRPVAAASGKRLASLIYDLVREQLLEGAYQAGERLQIEMLKAEYGVSKQPIMDALRRLASDGLIEIIPQVGCRVPVYEPEDIAAFFAIFGGTEGAVAGVAAQRCTAEQLSSLAVVNADILRLAADPSPAARAHRYRILNRQFHGIVHAMAHSPVVAEISRRMWDMSDLIINTSGGPQPLAFAVPARHEDHERIIAALQRADPEGARAEMETHILGTVAVIQPLGRWPGPLPDVVIKSAGPETGRAAKFGHRRPGEQERGDIRVQRPAGLDVAVVLDIDCVAEQGPPVAVVVEEVSQPRQSSARPRGDLSGGLRGGQVRRCPMRGSSIGNGNRVSATLDLTGKDGSLSSLP